MIEVDLFIREDNCPMFSQKQQLNQKQSQHHISPSRRDAYGLEEQTANLVKAIEADPLFLRLREQEIISVVQYHRFVCEADYLEYRNKKLAEFVIQYHLETMPEWRQAITGVAMEGPLRACAEDVGIPLRELLYHLRFVRKSTLSSQSQSSHSLEIPTMAVQKQTVDIAHVEQVGREFCRSYRVSERDFRDFVMSGNYSSDEVAKHIGCPVKVAEIMMDALNCMWIREEAGGGANSHANPVSSSIAVSDGEIVAEVCVDENGLLQIEWKGSRLCKRYVIDRERLKSWKAVPESQSAIRILEEKLNGINDRYSLLSNIIYVVCEVQKAFLLTGNHLLKRPLWQAEVARRVEAVRSTSCGRDQVCRLIRGQYLHTQHGRYLLKELMPSVKEVVTGIKKMHPTWSDQRIADHITRNFGVCRTRKTVSYHRSPSVTGELSEDDGSCS